jgi:outer membrane murein-binding lipoprotein Lpp
LIPLHNDGRSMMKHVLIAAACAAVLLTGCSGVDKDGTADNVIKELERSGQPLTGDQKQCIRDAIRSYSDDDLRALSDDTASNELQADFAARLDDCLA